MTDGDSANAMTVAYNNARLNAVDQFIDIYIYPQNKAGASVDYVTTGCLRCCGRATEPLEGLLLASQPATAMVLY